MVLFDFLHKEDLVIIGLVCKYVIFTYFFGSSEIEVLHTSVDSANSHNYEKITFTGLRGGTRKSYHNLTFNLSCQFPSLFAPELQWPGKYTF